MQWQATTRLEVSRHRRVNAVNPTATHFDETLGKTTARQNAASGEENMSFVLDGIGQFLARYLEKPVQGYEPFTPSDPAALRPPWQLAALQWANSGNNMTGGAFQLFLPSAVAPLQGDRSC